MGTCPWIDRESSVVVAWAKMVVAGAAATSAEAFDAAIPANASAAQAAQRPLPHMAGRPENGMTRLPESVQNPGRRTALPSVSAPLDSLPARCESICASATEPAQFFPPLAEN